MTVTLAAFVLLVEPSTKIDWWTQARFVLLEPVADAGPCVIDAVYSTVCASPGSFPVSIHTTALFRPLAFGWVIAHDCVTPVVLMHDAVLSANDFEI